MRTCRQRNDRDDTFYTISNQQVGKEEENKLAPPCRTQLLRFANRLSRLYVVRMTLLQVCGSGYHLLLAAPAALPSREGEIGAALCLAMATGTVWPIRNVPGRC